MIASTHYRVVAPDGKVTAYGCGWAGEKSVLKTADARKVNCAACQRTKEWKAAMPKPPPKPHVKCLVCGEVYPRDILRHRCPFEGVEHANMHREEQRSIKSLEATVRDLEYRLARLEESPLCGVEKEAKE